MYYVYIITNKFNTVLYIGVTNNLERRLYEHRNMLVEGFSSKYKLTKLVYYEETKDVNEAILREKQLKGWNRQKKNSLIATLNPMWEKLQS